MLTLFFCLGLAVFPQADTPLSPDFTGSLLDSAVVLGYTDVARAKDVLYLKQGNEMKPLFAHRETDGTLSSFFKSLGRMTYNPKTKTMVFVGWHRALNHGKPTLFQLKTTGELEMLVAYEPTKYPRGGSAYDEALKVHADAVPVLFNQSDEIMSGFKATLKGSFCTFYWEPGGEKLLIFGHKDLYILDLAAKQLTVNNLTSYTPSLKQPTNLRVAPQEFFGAVPYLYTPKMIYRVGWDGKLTEVFAPKKQKVTTLMSKQVRTTKRAKWDQPLDIISRKNLLQHQGLVYDQDGRLLFAVDPEETFFDVAEKANQVVVYNQTRQSVATMDLATGEIIHRQRVNGRFSGIQTDPTATYLVLSKAKKKKQDPEITIYKRDGKALTEVNRVAKVKDSFLSGIGAFFTKEDRLYCTDFSGNTCESSLQIGAKMKWAVYSEDQLLYSNIPFIDYARIYANRAAFALHQQMFHQQWHQNIHNQAVKNAINHR